MNWLMSPYVDLNAVAAQLYGGGSRLHTRRLQDRLRGATPFKPWELERLEVIHRQVLQEISGNAVREEASLLEVA
jgi:hypothetical protein